MTNTGGRVDRSLDPIGDTDGDSLCFTRRIAKTVNDWVLATREDLGSSIVALFEGCGFAIDHAAWSIFNTVIQKPSFAQNAGSLGFDDMVVFDGQFYVIAHATTKSARSVLNDFQLTRNTGRGCVNLSSGISHDVTFGNNSIVTSIPLLVGIPEP